LKARTIPFKRIYEELGNRASEVTWDQIKPSLEPSDDRILCTSIRNISSGYLGERPSVTRQCLLLLPNDSGKDTYHRVGFWTAGIPKPPGPAMIGGIDFASLMKSLMKYEDVIDYDKPPYEGWEEKVITIV
jgi:hypothetical protein